MPDLIQIGLQNEILRTKSENIVKFNNSLKKIEKKMLKCLKKNKGLGLAAPQIGLNLRMIIVNLDKTNSKLIMCNPNIIFKSENIFSYQEGCLSLPGVWGNVNRSASVVVEFQDTNGQKNKIKLEDMNARIVQHEIDHLNGVLFLDKVEGEIVVDENVDYQKLQLKEEL